MKNSRANEHGKESMIMVYLRMTFYWKHDDEEYVANRRHDDNVLKKDMFVLLNDKACGCICLRNMVSIWHDERIDKREKKKEGVRNACLYILWHDH